MLSSVKKYDITKSDKVCMHPGSHIHKGIEQALRTYPWIVCCKDSRNQMAFQEVESCMIFLNTFPTLTWITGTSMSMTSSAAIYGR
jgi:hypothetical protein